jgi:hypothetical protein
MAQAKTQQELFNEAAAKLEAEHGPVISISHPDGSCFGFKRMTRVEFNLREARINRGEEDASDKLLQERCVWPSREEWNKYVASSVFETLAYAKAYREAHGGADARVADADEVPPDGDPSLKYLTNGTVIFGFRKPGRAEVKMFQAATVAKQRGEKQKTEPVEVLLMACAAPGFSAWVEDNLFGISSFADAFFDAFGMTAAQASGARVSGK